jgi:diaminopimelate decarboxylase
MLARRAGCPAERIFFSGPGKTEVELGLVLAQGIGEIHIESLREAERIVTISRRLGVKARVAVRVNPTSEVGGGAMRMGGRPSPFGIDEERLDAAVDQVLTDPALEFHGIHLFVATQILDAGVLLAQYRNGLAIARRVAQRIGRPIQTVDFGGGLGIPYFDGEQELDMDAVRAGLADLMREVEADPLFQSTGFVIEPGRYLIGEAGIYIARINDMKISRGKKFLILDGGMNHHLAASGNLGQTIKRNFPLCILNRLDEPLTDTVEVVGPLCTPLDTLARNLEMPRAEVGDLVGIFQSGAYARTASPLGFLSHPEPPEVWVDRGEWRVIRSRGDASDNSNECDARSVPD